MVEALGQGPVGGPWIPILIFTDADTDISVLVSVRKIIKYHIGIRIGVGIGNYKIQISVSVSVLVKIIKAFVEKNFFVT